VPVNDAELLEFMRDIAVGDIAIATSTLRRSPQLATARLEASGATRQDARTSFIEAMQHYVYRGDMALHVAAASYQVELLGMLIEAGADVSARNRRGAERADPKLINRSGSTPMTLATRTTGRGGSGSVEARAQQEQILRLLSASG
jgi:hypothetical protein